MNQLEVFVRCPFNTFSHNHYLQTICYFFIITITFFYIKVIVAVFSSGCLQIGFGILIIDTLSFKGPKLAAPGVHI